MFQVYGRQAGSKGGGVVVLGYRGGRRRDTVYQGMSGISHGKMIQK